MRRATLMNEISAHKINHSKHNCSDDQLTTKSSRLCACVTTLFCCRQSNSGKTLLLSRLKTLIVHTHGSSPSPVRKLVRSPVRWHCQQEHAQNIPTESSDGRANCCLHYKHAFWHVWEIDDDFEHEHGKGATLSHLQVGVVFCFHNKVWPNQLKAHLSQWVYEANSSTHSTVLCQPTTSHNLSQVHLIPRGSDQQKHGNEFDQAGALLGHAELEKKKAARLAQCRVSIMKRNTKHDDTR